ncbi:MAG: hypothetical protein OHK0013_19180 [Sandaracinaceae bacterium]
MFVALGAILIGLAACGERREDPAPPRVGALPESDVPLDALARRHGRLRQRLEVRGYDVMERQARVFVLESRSVAIPVDLSVDRCHTFVALGSAGLRDLHAVLYDGEGVEVARDAVPGEGALVHTCPQPLNGAPSMPHHLVVSAVEGTGTVAISEAESVPSRGEGFEGIFDELLAPRVPFRDVEEALARGRTALRARGLAPVLEPRIDVLPERGSARADLEVELGRCYVAIARGGEGVEDLDLFLFDDAGVEVARDLRRGAEATVEHCAQGSGRYRIEVRAYRGRGAVGIAAFVAQTRAQPARGDDSIAVGEALGEGPARNDPMLALAVSVAQLVALGFEEPVLVGPAAVINPGEVLTHDVVVGPGCGLLVAEGSDEAMDLDLYLADPNGRELDVDTDTRSRAAVRACFDTARVLRVAVKVYGRDGTYALGLVRAPRDVTDVRTMRLVELSAEPRARGYVEREQHALELGSGGREGRSTTLAPGRCLAIVAAGAESLRDVDLELRGADGRVLASDSGPAPHATLGWCAPEQALGPVPLAWEAVAYAGEGSVTVRLLEGPP